MTSYGTDDIWLLSTSLQKFTNVFLGGRISVMWRLCRGVLQDPDG
jgi:hypothetical protein